MIVMDQAQKELDQARALYRRRYNRGYSLSEQGHAERAQAILDAANADLRAAEQKFAAARS